MPIRQWRYLQIIMCYMMMYILSGYEILLISPRPSGGHPHRYGWFVLIRWHLRPDCLWPLSLRGPVAPVDLSAPSGPDGLQWTSVDPVGLSGPWRALVDLSGLSWTQWKKCLESAILGIFVFMCRPAATATAFSYRLTIRRSWLDLQSFCTNVQGHRSTSRQPSRLKVLL